MAIRIEILTDATVTLRNGEKKEFEAIYPTYNGLVFGEIIPETSIFEKSKKRRYGFSKPVEKIQVQYNIFNDIGFIQNGSYTFFTGQETHAYTQKLTNGEIRDKFF